MEKFRIKNRLWISILLILSICMMSIHVYGGEKREWAKVSDWTEVIVAGDSESDQVKVGAEGKLRIQCWDTISIKSFFNYRRPQLQSDFYSQYL